MNKYFLREFLFPNHCFLCDEKLNFSEKYICENCVARLESFSLDELIEYRKNNLSEAYFCFIGFHFDKYSKRLVHLLKYRKSKHLGYKLSEILDEKFHEDLKFIQLDVILPCPLSKEREKEREFNQAEVLAYEVSKNLGIRLSKNELIRVKSTKSQANLSQKKRLKNLTGAFEFNPQKSYKKILIVDDVITTGSTMKQMIQAIHIKNPEAKCYVLAFASP
jgi:ComF family protein